jgi:hypothetical protein
MRRFISKAVQWGWTSEAEWTGIGKTFKISIPTKKSYAMYEPRGLTIKSIKYDEVSKCIELLGHYEEKDKLL